MPDEEQPNTVSLRLCEGHSDDIERLYRRHKDTDTEIGAMKNRLITVEGRVSVIETLITTIGSDLRSIQASLNSSQRDREHLAEMIQAQSRILVQHTTEEATRQIEHTSSIQRLTRAMLIIGGLVGTVLLMIGGLLGEESLLIRIINATIGFGG